MKFENNIIDFMQKKSKFERVEDKKLLVIEFRKQIFKKFLEMKDIEEFVELLNHVNQIVYKNSKILEVKRITYHAFYNKKCYTSFEISKKYGGTRTINAPIESLKNIQMTVAFILSCIYKFPMVVHGFTNDKSVVTNAKHHVNKNYVYNIDLEDFFGSIHKARIEKRLQVKPYNLSNKKAEIATLIARLVTIKSSKEEIIDGETISKKYAKLPQGSPTSPILSNIICERLDRRLLGLAKKFNVKYTRYADDITFSSMHNVYQKDSDFLIELERIITDQNFKINPKKTRLQKRGYRQEVTGLIVNEKVNVDRRYIKQLRAMLYSIEKSIRENGTIDKAEENFERHYLKDKGHLIDKVPSMESVLLGKLQYLKMVKGVEGTYLKLITRYNKIPFNLPKIEKEAKIEKEYIIESQKTLSEILKNFSSDNLKYTNHPWTDSLNYKDFKRKLDRGWKEIEDELEKLSSSLYESTKEFLFDKTYSGFASDEVITQLEEGIKPDNIEELSHSIDKFKSSIVIKNDEGLTLLDMFERILEKNELNINVDLDNIETFSKKIFTDVKGLEDAIGIILKDIIKMQSDATIKVLFNEETDDNDLVDLKIIHLKSECSNSSKELHNTIGETGNFTSIYETLKSVCHWSVETECSDGKKRIEYLYSEKDNSNPHIVPIPNEIEGFTHILRLYK